MINMTAKEDKDMDIPGILKILEAPPSRFPHQAIIAANAQKEKIIPEFLKLIGEPKVLLKKCKEIPDYLGHIYAFFFLAKYRIKKAFPLIIQLFQSPTSDIDALGTDLLIENFPAVIGSVYDENLEPVKEIIENSEHNEYIRATMLQALLYLVIHGQYPKESFIKYCMVLFRDSSKLEKRPSMVWCILVKIAGLLAEKRLLNEIQAAFSHGLVDMTYIRLNAVKRMMKQGWDQNLKRLRKDPMYQPITDIPAMMEWWACFRG